ncbi:Hypothetical predicted protein, partial [Paramuricea clavata]
NHSTGHFLRICFLDFSKAFDRRRQRPVSPKSDLTSIATWASNNLMKLNAKKCKEMQICFFRNKPELPHLCVEDQILECVSSHKVLGLIIQDDPKWTNIFR